MTPSWSTRSLAFALSGAMACGAIERIQDAVERVRDDDRQAPLAEEIAPPVEPDSAPAADDVPAASDSAPAVATPAPPDELELKDVELEWVERSMWGYYGMHDKTKTLRVHATGKLRAAIGRDSNVTVKAVCAAEPVPLADADVASIKGGYLDPVPAAPEEFPIRVDLFQTIQPPSPELCRVQFLLIDNKATPPRRGTVELCWRKNSKAAVACTKDDTLPPSAEAKDAWDVERVEFTASGELLFTVVAGRTRAPDRIALRTTCYVGDKRYVDFDFLVGRWYALAAGEGMRQRTYMNDLSDMLRFAECDLAFQDAGYDFEKFALRGTKDIQHLCVRPTGLARGACRIEASEPAAWDPTSAPAKVEYAHSGAHVYSGWLNAHLSGELTVLAGLAKDARIEVVARCGKREAKQSITTPVGLELVWPGQTVRMWAGASIAAKSTKGCEVETVLTANDGHGKPKTWSLHRMCFAKDGTGRACT
jgi:hypothetical protein